MLVKRSMVSLALVLSGAAALVYEVAWSRMLQRVFGVSDLAIATVLAAYFLGLGIGSYAGGRVAARTRRPERLYALAEIAIAVFAFGSLGLMPLVDGAHAALGEEMGFFALSAIRFGLALVVLLPPTVLMGATLPILVSGLKEHERNGGWAKDAGFLYAANTIGATIGAGAAGFWLLPTIGTRASLGVAAAASLAAAALVLASFARSASRTPSQLETAPGPLPREVKWAAFAAGVGGLASLSGEVVWTRILRIVVQGTTQAFAGMLVVYLAGIALGGFVGSRLASSPERSARRLGFAQLGLGLLSMLALVVANALPPLLSLVQGPGDLSMASSHSVIVLAAVLLGPIALVLGTTIPLAWSMVPASAASSSSVSGRVLAANTIGGLVGSLVTGFWLIPTIGVNATVIVLVLIHALVGASALRAFATTPRAKGLALVAPALVAALALVVAPSVSLAYLTQARENSPRAVLENWRASWQEPVAFLREGRNTTVTVLKGPTNLRLFNDGRPESGLSSSKPGFGPELVLLGTLPSLYGTRHERAMAIGLGGGHTATGLLAADYARVDVVELEEAVVEAARLIHSAFHVPFALDDPRAHLVVDDARARLGRATPGTYDAIVSQPSHPWLAGSSALYTEEFFREVACALHEDGSFVLWVNLFRNDVPHVRDVVATLLRVFPSVDGFVREGSSFVFVARKNGRKPTASRFASLVAMPRAQEILEPARLGTIADYFASLEMTTPEARRFAEGGVVLTDDIPRMELDLGALSEASAVSLRDLDGAFSGEEWFEGFPISGLSGAELSALLHARIETVAPRPKALARAVATMRRVVAESSASRSMLEGDVAFAEGDPARAVALWRSSRLDAAIALADQWEPLLRPSSNPSRWEEARRARATAVELTARARASASGGNDVAAKTWATLALEAYPAQASAAVVLVDVLMRAGDRERAQQIIDEGLVETVGLPSSSRTLVQSATRHGLRVGNAVASDDFPATSSANSTTSTAPSSSPSSGD